MHYVIGDVHGCFDEMMRLIQKIEKQDEDAIIYFVGDFIDRGPKVWETLQWMMKNITPVGKYRSVRGNHEEMVCEWFRTVGEWWTEEREPDIGLKYGFHKVLKEQQCFTKEKVSEIVDFFESLPLWRLVETKALFDEEQQYVIGHAYVPRPEELVSMTKEEKKYVCLWERRHMWGYHGANNQILVHGHTPTVSDEYILRNPKVRPGMIGYNRSCINVDSGCCYFYTDLGSQYPCLLSGICLESKKEFYSDTVEERFEAHIKRNKPALLNVLNSEEVAKLYAEEYWKEIEYRKY